MVLFFPTVTYLDPLVGIKLRIRPLVRVAVQYRRSDGDASSFMTSPRDRIAQPPQSQPLVPRITPLYGTIL